MKEFLSAIKNYRASSEIEAYDKVVSKWLIEAKEGGFAEQLLDELIFYAKKAEEQIEKDAVKKAEIKQSSHCDGSRTATLK